MEEMEENSSDSFSVSSHSSDSSEDGLSDSDGVQPKVKSRKRIRRPQEWKRNKRKCLRNAGKEYINSKGTKVPPRVAVIDCKCALRCFETASSSEREKILKEFNALASFDLQNSYLHGLIHSAEPKRRYTSKGNDSKRKKTYFYYLRIEGVLKRVCLRAFCGVHGVTVKRIRNIRGKDCSPPIDQRGKHNNYPNRTPADSVACVERHISSFPQ